MECSHLLKACLVPTPASKKTSAALRCLGCQGPASSTWVCCHCGVVNCGRYVKAHAKTHYEMNPKHSVCMNVQNYAVYCYLCDEYVVNDSDSDNLQQLRLFLQKREPPSPSLANEENHVAKSIRKGEKRKLAQGKGGHGSPKRTKVIIRPRPRTVGLRNLGNTCFMNAVLQSLNNIREFSGYIKQLPSLEKKARKFAKPLTRRSNEDSVLLIEELRKTLLSLWQSKSAISPDSLFSVIWKVVPRFRGYQQQDAHEFMRYLLDRLHQELTTLPTAVPQWASGLVPATPGAPCLSTTPQPSLSLGSMSGRLRHTVVTAIFGGVLQSEVNCLACNMESKKHDPFLDLSLDIPANFTCKTPSPKDGEDLCTLEDCLKSFTDIEELASTELYLCGNCKKRQRSTKKFWIRKLPNVLCLHLKRFRWGLGLRTKVETYVKFPVAGLDMSPYVLNNMHRTRESCSGNSMYDLGAVVVHHGSGAGSGHYTSYAVHDGSWYHFNDSSVSACDMDVVEKCKGYILFYVRRELNLTKYWRASLPAATSNQSVSAVASPSTSRPNGSV